MSHTQSAPMCIAHITREAETINRWDNIKHVNTKILRLENIMIGNIQYLIKYKIQNQWEYHIHTAANEGFNLKIF